MDFRFAAYDPATGDYRRMLPRPASVQIGDTFGTRGTLKLTFAGGLALETFLEVRAQVSFGGEWTPVGPALLRLGGSHEDTDQAGMRTVTFVSREWVLGKARVGEGDLELIDGKRPFYQASPGDIMRTLLLEAQDRGAAAGIELGGFTAAQDSAGNAWPKVATIYYGPGLPIASVLENLVEQGMCDYRVNGRVLELYAPETELGRDLTTGDPVRVHGSVTEAPVTYTLEDLTTSALLIGEEGFELEVANPSAPRDYGELEVTIEQGGVNSEGTARTMIDAELQRGSREVREITRTQKAATARHLPFRDYRVGDYVQALDGGRWERYRVREVQLVMGDDGWTVHTVLNDRLQELLLKLAKRTNGIVNGTKGTGGDGTPPAPAPRPGIEPAAPEGLVLDQQVYLDAAGNARGLVTAGWGAVTESVRGRAIDIGGYELWRRDNETYAPWRIVASTDGDIETTDSPVWLTRGDGSAAEYQWRVRAVAQESGREGEWSRPVTMTMTQDTTPPPPPSAPKVTTGFRIVTVEWDGLTEDGTDMPSDFSRVRVYLAATEDMADAVLACSLSYPGSWNSETMAADVPVWVTMTAVDRVGNESDPTVPVSVTPHALVDEQSIQDEVDRIHETIQDAQDSLRDDLEKVIVDNAGNVITWSPTRPSEGKPGDSWFRTSGTEIVGQYGYEGGRWVERKLADETIANLNAGKINAGYLDAARIAANTLTADKLLVGSSRNLLPNGDLTVGDATGWPGGGEYDESDTPPGLAAAMTWPPGTRSYSLREFGHFPVSEGDSLVFEVWVKADKPASRMYVEARDQDGAHIAPQQAARWAPEGWTNGSNSYPVGRAPVPTEWTLWRTRLKISNPETTSVTLGSLYVNHSSGEVKDAEVRTAGLALYKAVGATLIEDGSITTGKIVANAITSGLIQSGAVRAGHIQANAVEADTIAAGAIDGKIITGATVRTSATGARVVLNAGGFYAYNASGAQTVGISAQTGAVDLTANVSQTNSYGSAMFGPTLYAGDDSTPALAFRVPGYDWYGSGGFYARDDGSTGFPTTRLQGFLNGSQDGSHLSFAPGGTSTDASTYFERMYSSGGRATLRFNASRGAYLTTDGNSSLVQLAARTHSGSNRFSYLHLSGEDGDRNVYLHSTSGNVYIRSSTADGGGTNRARLTLQNDGSAFLVGRGGNVYIDAATSDGGVYLRKRNGSESATGAYVRASTNGAAIDSGGSNNTYVRANKGNEVQIAAATLNIYRIPSGSGVTLQQSGSRVYRASSSRRNKLRIEDATYDTPDLEERLLSVRPRSWYEVGNADAYAEYLDRLGAWTPLAEGESCEACEAEDAGEPCSAHREPTPAAVPRRNLGAVAEEIEELGLEHLVVYDPDGRPDGLMYDRVGVLLIPTVKRLRDRVDELERQIGEHHG